MWKNSAWSLARSLQGFECTLCFCLFFWPFFLLVFPGLASLCSAIVALLILVCAALDKHFIFFRSTLEALWKANWPALTELCPPDSAIFYIVLQVNSSLPLGQVALNFHCRRDDFPRPLLIGQVGIKSYYPGLQVFFSGKVAIRSWSRLRCPQSQLHYENQKNPLVPRVKSYLSSKKIYLSRMALFTNTTIFMWDRDTQRVYFQKSPNFQS